MMFTDFVLKMVFYSSFKDCPSFGVGEVEPPTPVALNESGENSENKYVC